jgi:hypothetical protein
MRYKFTIQERNGAVVYVLSFGNDTPMPIAEVIAYSDNHASAEDPHGTRHYVYSKAGKIVSIHLHDVPRLLPHFDRARPETIRMPEMHAIRFGDPPVPTLLLRFRPDPPDNRTAYTIAPNVFLVFQGEELAELYVTDVYRLIAEVA